MSENKSIFEILRLVDVSEHTDLKNDLTYLSWPWAVDEITKRYPEMEYDIWRDEEGKPYIYDENLGYMVFTRVTVGGTTKKMWLAVMDGANHAMKSEPYEYKVKNKLFKYAKLNPDDGKYYDKYKKEQPEYLTKHCEAATMFDINTAIMRCLVKNFAMFGLGLYIYAGEDLPEEETVKETKEDIQKQRDVYIKAIRQLLDETKVTEEQLVTACDEKLKETATKVEQLSTNALIYGNRLLTAKKEKMQKEG